MQDVQSALCLVITAASPGLLPAGCRGWTRETPMMISGPDLCFPSHEISVPRFIYAGGNTHGQGCPPYIKLVKYSIRVETPLTPISHPIQNQPTMETDTCGFFMASEVSLHLPEKDTPSGSANMSALILFFLLIFLPL